MGPVLLYRQAFGLAVGRLLGIAAALVYGKAWHAELLLSRIGEFQSTETSGFARFLSPFRLLGDIAFTDPLSVLFGRGPGSITAALDTVAYTAHDPTWGKLLFEYGIAGTLVFLTFITVCLFRGSHSRWISGFLLFGYLFFGGMLLDPRFAAIMLALMTLQRPVSSPHRA